MTDNRHLSSSKRPLRRAAALAVFLIIVAGVTSGCQPKGLTSSQDELATALALSAYAPKDRQLILWSRDKSGELYSHWIAGNDDDIRVIASTKGLLIPWNNRLWLYERNEIALDLCDCPLELVDDKIEESASDEEGQRESLSTAYLESSRLRDIITDEIVPIDAPITDSSQPPTEIKFASTPTSSIGRYLIVDHRTEARYCGGTPSVKSQGFVVVDLDTGEKTKLFSDSELKDIEKNEKESALELVREGNVALASDTWKLTLTAVAPRVNKDGLLTLVYEFSAQTTPVDQGENWQVYTHSVWVPAHKIPEKLSEFEIISPLVHMFVAMFPHVDIRGFFEVSPAPEMSAIMLKQFAGAHP